MATGSKVDSQTDLYVNIHLEIIDKMYQPSTPLHLHEPAINIMDVK